MRRGLSLGLFLLLHAPAVSAQISPGPLARAHASLEGALRCTTCHTGGRQALSANCLACHKDIGWLVQRERGFHASTGGATCASCHPDHAGESFALIKWPEGDSEHFDHTRAGWPLDGRHARATCADCHTAKYRVSEATLLSVRKTGAGWTGLERTCTACHEDPHRGALDHTCVTCHDTNRWHETPRFDHVRTRYPLTGKHAAVACDKCHLDARLGLRADARGRPVPLFRPLAFGQCSACHTDPHAGRLGPKCAACHVTGGFKVFEAASFDHERTHYPLRGAHQRVSCEGCHDFSDRPGARRNPVAFAACGDCHKDPHGATATLAGRVVDCSACHDLAAFTPSTFTAVRHRDARYPLEGRHAAVRCADCHVKTPATAGGLWGTARVVIRPPYARCRDCHTDDPHRERTEQDCRDCHDLHGYRPSTVTVGAHLKYRFALEGAHRAVPCAGCHREIQTVAAGPRTAAGGLFPPLRFSAPQTCAQCHTGPHGGQFAARADGGRCDACHDPDVWRPAARFDHDRDATFSLKGAHTGVPCQRCHRPAGPGLDRIYRPVTAKCESCHGSEAR